MSDKKLIQQSNEAYYDSGEPILTDQEFDLLAETGLDQDPRNFRTKVAHHLPMGSLAKAKDAKTLARWIQAHTGSILVVMPKLDGASIALSYRRYALDRAATRGDGVEGNDITSNVKCTQVPHYVGPADMEARAEAIIPKKYKDDFDKNLRNTVAGMLGAKDTRPDLHKVDLVIFDVYGDGLESWNEKKAALAVLPDNATVPYKVVSVVDPHSLYNDLVDDYDYWSENLPWAIDGLVLTVVKDPDAPMEIPELMPSNKISVKYQDPSVDAIIGSIEWNQGKYGKLAPVLVLQDPVEIDGTTVQRISASNYSLLKAAGLGIGAEIQVIKANQIIPYVAGVDTPSMRGTELPLCPDCGTPASLNETGVDAICPSDTCPGKILVTLQKQIEIFDIDFVSESTIEKLVDAGHDSLEKLFALTVKDIVGIEGFGLKSARYFVDALHNTPLTEAKVFKMVGLKGLGERKGQMLLDHYGSLVDMVTLICAKGRVDDIPNFGDIQKDLVYRNTARIQAVHCHLADDLGVEIIPHIQKSTSLKVCATGACPGYGRKELEKLLADKGYTLISGVTKDCDLLLCADPTGSSSKLKKATAQGVKIQSYTEFLVEVG